MCGLYASLGLESQKFRLDRINHRGPDNDAWREFETAAGLLCLGHKRLAIIDTDESAHQPMFSKNDKSALIVNGEIYNYIEIREKLSALGYSFTTNSDSEVLLQLIDVWGIDGLKLLSGMFAFVHVNFETQKLLVARDAYGIKPLYYITTDTGVVFASEIKQIYDFESKTPKLNQKIAQDFLVHGITDHSEETFFEGIKQLRGGHYIEIDIEKTFAKGENFSKRWYERPIQKPLEKSLEETARIYKSSFDYSIMLHLRLDVPFGVCLSGGLDSSAILGAATKIKGKNIETVSIVFPGEAIDESKFIDYANKYNSTIPNKVEIHEDNLASALDKTVYHQDEPFGSLSILAQYFLFQKANERGLKVMLDGQGADEQLAGYTGIYDFVLLKQLRKLKIASAIKLILARNKIGDSTIFEQVKFITFTLIGKYLTAKKKCFVQNSLFEFAVKSPEELSKELIKANNLQNVDSISSLCYLLSFCTSLPMLLRFADRNSMAFSIEDRVPFVNNELMGIGLNIDEVNRFDITLSKIVLRKALSQYLPNDIIKRKDKIGFEPPHVKWLKNQLAAQLEEGLCAFFNEYNNLINRAEFEKIYNKFLYLNVYNPIIWRVASMGLWVKKFGAQR